MTHNQDQQARDIAGKLTKAQRVAINESRPTIFGKDTVVPYRHWRALPGLISKGHVEAGSSQRLTPLGLQVRAILQEQGK